MKRSYLLFILALCELTYQSAQAGGNEEITISNCVPPSQEEEEFEPALCPFKLAEVTKVKILDRVEDQNDLYYNPKDCADFLALTEPDIIKFFQTANLVTASDAHAKLAETSPCHISGQFHFKDGSTAHWDLQSNIHLGHITINQSGNQASPLNLYCPQLCGFIPTYRK